MREEHPLQRELLEPPLQGTTSAQVTEMSEVAVLQNKALELSLVREVRPVFVYDAKLAKEKTGNAQRQAKHREQREQKGLMMAEVPREIFELVRSKYGGDWSKFTAVMSPLVVAPQTPVFGEAGLVPRIPESIIHTVATTENLKVEIESDGGIELWLQKKITFAIDSMPKPATISPEIVERIVEKPVIKFTPEQKISLRIGEKVQKITGWRAFIARKLLNIR